MGRAKKKGSARKEREPEEPDEELEDDDDALIARDDAMARLAAARVQLTAALEGIDDALGYFVTPDDDKEGEERDDAMETALELCGDASRSIEAAQKAFEDADVGAAEIEGE